MKPYYTDQQRKEFRDTKIGVFPDGEYIGRLIDVEEKVTVNSFGESLRLHMKYEVLNPSEFLGRTYIQFVPLDGHFFIIKTILKKFGVEDVELDEVGTVLKDFIGTDVTFELSTKDTYQNSKIKKVHENDLETDHREDDFPDELKM